MKAGVEIYEFMPEPNSHAQLVERYDRISHYAPVFGLHAKSMVIDGEIVFIGTFNLDPRSANLNTEVGMLARDRELARQVTESIETDMLPGNSWPTTLDFNPDFTVRRTKRFRTWINRLLPLDPIL